ncbi:MAG: DUF1345 domain-containing protein [Chitinophagaceae bacterium]
MKVVKHKFLRRVSGLKKLFFCLGIAIVVYLLLLNVNVDWGNRIILGWDAFCLVLLLLDWTLFFKTSADELPGMVRDQDDGIEVIFTIVLVGICFSLFGTLVLLVSKGGPAPHKLLHTIISLSPVLLSWILLHTIFAVRYAHLYHDHNSQKSGAAVGGLTFPTKEKLDYLDFAYFALVIGMTFQVSDVQVNSSVIRRFVLMHSLISFVFNTIIVALTINTIASLLQ